MTLSTPFAGIACGVAGSVAPVVDTPVVLGVQDHIGFTKGALILNLTGVEIPNGEVLSVEVTLETDSDPAFPNPVVIPGYVGCPIECVLGDNTDGLFGQPINAIPPAVPADFGPAPLCRIVILKCFGDSDRYVRATVTFRGGLGVVVVATAVYTYLGAGSPVNQAKGPMVPLLA